MQRRQLFVVAMLVYTLRYSWPVTGIDVFFQLGQLRCSKKAILFFCVLISGARSSVEGVQLFSAVHKLIKPHTESFLLAPLLATRHVELQLYSEVCRHNAKAKYLFSRTSDVRVGHAVVLRRCLKLAKCLVRVQSL